jgi:hypothetical protein
MAARPAFVSSIHPRTQLRAHAAIDVPQFYAHDCRAAA